MFYIGQKVVCVDAKIRSPQPGWVYPKLFKGAVYDVKNLRNCGGCGLLVLNVGIRADLSGIRIAAHHCDTCGHEEIATSSFHFIEHWRFVPLDEDILELVNELTESVTMPL